MNQENMVLIHLKSGRRLTSAQAFELYGITRLSAKIFTLRKKGYHIEKIKRTTINRYGNNSSYGEYYLVESEDE